MPAGSRCSWPIRRPPRTPGGVLVIDDSGDRKDGSETAHVGKQYLGSVGQDRPRRRHRDHMLGGRARLLPAARRALHPRPAFPEREERPGLPHEAADRSRPGRQAKEAGVVLRAVVADCAYGDQDVFRRELVDAGLPFVMAIKPRHGAWAYGGQRVHPPRCRPRPGLARPGRCPVTGARSTRTFRDGHTDDMVGRRRAPGLVGPGRKRPPGRGHRRPGHPAAHSPPGTWPPTCRGPADHVRRTARTRRPT